MLPYIYPQGTIATRTAQGYRIAIPVGTFLTPVVQAGGLVLQPTMIPQPPSPPSRDVDAFGRDPRQPPDDSDQLEGSSKTHDEVDAQAEMPPLAREVDEKAFEKATGAYHWYTDPLVAAPVGVGVVGVVALAIAWWRKRKRRG